ncbi:hypothetical protein IscW_ISCW022577 [Ixodes scapularis]|uniref:RRM domain-containing protein n=1 Tax=Ixodes scapularis TaxID=6945 RepID=B7QBA8_IXOSC|nr:hypothetical protein IscW_ISCW022577 [Ixodes scapularis]|eukprot:XP_002412834.1 hypothetical protein IscW_ISCW022577 [Ixodes scapularis]
MDYGFRARVPEGSNKEDTDNRFHRAAASATIYISDWYDMGCSVIVRLAGELAGPAARTAFKRRSATTCCSGNEPVRTLFVSGLPMDAKPRELYLLFRAYKGYEGSLLKVTQKNGKTSSPVGFVTFSSRAGAEAAKQELQESGEV